MSLAGRACRSKISAGSCNFAAAIFTYAVTRIGKVLDLTRRHRETVSIAQTHTVETWLFSLKPGRQLALRTALGYVVIVASSSSSPGVVVDECPAVQAVGESNHVPFLGIDTSALSASGSHYCPWNIVAKYVIVDVRVSRCQFAI